MKQLILFFIVFYTFSRTNHAFDVPHIHYVLVSSVVEPNHSELDDLMGLSILPLFGVLYAPWAPISHYGLMEKYSLIFASDPDNVTTISALDLEHYSAIYFENLVRNRTANSSTAATLKGLRRALDIESNRTVVLLATNTKPTDTELVEEIIETMTKKQYPVAVFQVGQNRNTFRSIMRNLTNNFSQGIIDAINPDDAKLGKEYSSIVEPSRSIGFVMWANAVTEKFYLSLETEYFQKEVNLKSLVMVYDIIHSSSRYLTDISNRMKLDASSYFIIKGKSPDEPFPVIFSSKQPNVTNITAFSNTTAEGYQTMIKSQLKNLPSKASLRTFLAALKTIQPHSWIVYYFDDIPASETEILSEIVQLIMDKKIRVEMKPFGDRLMPDVKLPVAYRTIVSASYIARGTGYRVMFDWVSSLVIFMCLFIVKLV